MAFLFSPPRPRSRCNLKSFSRFLSTHLPLLSRHGASRLFSNIYFAPALSSVRRVSLLIFFSLVMECFSSSLLVSRRTVSSFACCLLFVVGFSLLLLLRLLLVLSLVCLAVYIHKCVCVCGAGGMGVLCLCLAAGGHLFFCSDAITPKPSVYSPPVVSAVYQPYAEPIDAAFILSISFCQAADLFFS